MKRRQFCAKLPWDRLLKDRLLLTMRTTAIPLHRKLNRGQFRRALCPPFFDQYSTLHGPALAQWRISLLPVLPPFSGLSCLRKWPCLGATSMWRTIAGIFMRKSYLLTVLGVEFKSLKQLVSKIFELSSIKVSATLEIYSF